MNRPKAAAQQPHQIAKVYCPMCTHTVDAAVERGQKRLIVTPGQKCPHCSSSLDAGYIFHAGRAA